MPFFRDYPSSFAPGPRVRPLLTGVGVVALVLAWRVVVWFWPDNGATAARDAAALVGIFVGAVLLGAAVLFLTVGRLLIGRVYYGLLADESAVLSRLGAALADLRQSPTPTRLALVESLAAAGMDSRRLRRPLVHLLTAFLRESRPRSGDCPPSGTAPAGPTDARMLPAETAGKLVVLLSGIVSVAEADEHVRPDLARVDLAGLTAEGVCLPSADLTGATLCGARWIKADLRAARMSGTDMTKARLDAADLTGARLTGIRAAGANFTGAFLTGADLSGADLTGADLTGTFLGGATLEGTDLCGADLGTAFDMTPAQLSRAKTDDRTRKPVTW